MAENMPESNQFVWIRLVNNDVAAKVAVKKLEVVPGRAKLIYGGPRPPSNGSGVKSARAGNEGAAFLMDTRHAGLESSPTSFDLGPAFDDAQEARDWITQPAGQAWAEASVNYFLLAYAPAAGGLRRLHGADLEATPNPPVDRFPLDDWDPVLLESISAAGATGPAVLGQMITLGPASAYGSTDEAIRQQLRADARMRLTFKDDINFEAQGLDQVTYRMFQVVGLSTDHPVNPALKALRDAVLDTVLPVLWYFKQRDPQEPRPRQLDTPIDPWFERPHWRNPGHPSFPGGHAAVAHTWAALLAAALPGHATELVNMADEIARRREIAGLHFPRDNKAGKSLGEQIAQAILQAINARPEDPELQPFVKGLAVVRSLAQARSS